MASQIVPRVDLLAQFLVFREEITRAVNRVLESGNYILGSEVQSFEDEFARFVDIPYVVGVADGTAAITLSLKALGIGVGDEVITSPFTAVPTIGAIVESGATPVFADIDVSTFLIDQQQILARVTAKTRAVVTVHMFGNVVDVASLRAQLPLHIAIVEDAAQAHGSTLGGRHAGGVGICGTFSFYPSKNLGACGDGGAIVTRDPNFAETLRLMRNHGCVMRDDYRVAGRNSRLDELQAAILREKLPHLVSMNEQRAHLVRLYKDVLPSSVLLQQVSSSVSSNWHVFQVRVEHRRDALREFLLEQGVQTDAFYPIPHPYAPALEYLGHKWGEFPMTERVCAEGIALPLYPELPPQTIELIGDLITHFLERGSRG